MDILNQAEKAINFKELKDSMSEFKEVVSYIVSLNKMIYKEMIKQGFDKEQAFEFSCSYIFSILMPKEMK